jgi:hypothetical protein
VLPCLIKKYLSVDCPTCGMQRAFYAFIHLDWQEALEYNAGIFPLIIFVILTIGLLLSKYVDAFKKIQGHLVLKSFYLTLIVLLIQYVIKLY